MSVRRALLRASIGAALILGLTLGFAAAAFAAPNVPVLHFEDLRTALAGAPGHQLSGYMLTVVQGTETTQIPVTVLSVPVTGDANTDLITFKATGPLIAEYGGIVSGMSGSPIYVDDGSGTDKLIGAVSYGEIFALGGFGYATPIDAMSAIETKYATIHKLTTPVLTPSGPATRIIITSEPEKYAAEAKTGALVAAPLAANFIGGLRPESIGYKKLAADFKRRGIPVTDIRTGLAGGASFKGAPSTELTAGASLGVLAARGDLWYGGVGTVTYANGNNVVGFGHPAYGNGLSALYMTNAWVEGVFPDSLEPYKIAEPTTIVGELTQDRSCGVMGVLGQIPAETTITATATDAQSGESTTSASYVPTKLFENGFADSYLAAEGVYMAGYKLYDTYSMGGSAHTTTTVVVEDKNHESYTIVMHNFVDSSEDIRWAAAMDTMDAVDQLQSVMRWANDTCTIRSIDLVADYSSQRKNAQIVSVNAPNGIRVGDNRVEVQAIVYGVDETQTISATITVPAGTATGGQISAMAYGDSGYDDGMFMTPSGYYSWYWGGSNRESIKELASDLNSSTPNTVIDVVYMPSYSPADYAAIYAAMGSSDEDEEVNVNISKLSVEPIDVEITADWPMSGEAEANLTYLTGAFKPSSIGYYGWGAQLSGVISNRSEPCTVTIYKTTAGSSVEETVAAVLAQEDEEEMLAFKYYVQGGFTTNTVFRLHVDADEDGYYSATDTYVTLGVRAAMALKPSSASVRKGGRVKLTAYVAPVSSSGGTVVFEQKVGKRWKKIKSATLFASGSQSIATAYYKPKGKGAHKVRARYLGGTFNAATVSRTSSIRVR
jgi:hypothetical protein